MKAIKTNQALAAMVLALVLTGCSGGNEPLKELADVYAQIGENEQKYAEEYRALYSLPRSEQEAALQKLNAQNEEWKADNERFAEKAIELAEKLKDAEIPCSSSEAMGLTIEKAVFETVNAQSNVANIVIAVYCQEPASKPYCFMQDAEGNLLWKIPATWSNGKFTINFRLTRDVEKTRIYGKLAKILVVTEAEYMANATGSNTGNATDDKTVTDVDPEPAYEGGDSSSSSIQGSGEIKVGANLAGALRNASNVTYEYNADSGIWATIGNIAIVIDEDQLNQQGIDFIRTILSDIEPNIAFKPEYVKPNATIQQIEAQ